jgi:hypothetical protein
MQAIDNRRGGRLAMSNRTFIPLGLHFLDCAAGDPGDFGIGIAPKHCQFGCTPTALTPRNTNWKWRDSQFPAPKDDSKFGALQSGGDRFVGVRSEQSFLSVCPQSSVCHRIQTNR